MKKGDKNAEMDISFGWLFAIIVGATILALVIFGVAKAIKTSSYAQQTAGAKELGVLLNPLETGFESLSSTPLTTNVETRIYNKCDNFGDFGKQKISISEYSFKNWPPPGIAVSFENKYIFSDEIVEGKNFYVFSKPFEYPFKITDLIILTSADKKYCFNKAPEKIKEEIMQIGQANLASNCTSPDYKDYIKICFEGGSGCKIKVNADRGEVEKNGDTLYFATLENNFDEKDYSLIYAAIFSDKDIYECQIKRLTKRASSLAEIYKEKAFLMSQRGCTSGAETDLEIFISQLESVQDSSGFSTQGIKYLIEDIKQQNENSMCRLW